MRRIEQNLYLGDISVFKQDLSDYSHLFIMSRDELGDEQSNAENYLFIDLIDDDEVSETEFVQCMKQGVNFILNQDRKVIVNCVGGVSRSPSVIISYLMLKYNMSYQQAFEKIPTFVRPNNAFQSYMKKEGYIERLI